MLRYTLKLSFIFVYLPVYILIRIINKLQNKSVVICGKSIIYLWCMNSISEIMKQIYFDCKLIADVNSVFILVDNVEDISK